MRLLRVCCNIMWFFEGSCLLVSSLEKRSGMEMNTMSAVQRMLGRTAPKTMPSSRSSNSYGVSDQVCMEELPHPARNLTVSRVVIMVTVAVLVGALTISTWYFTHSYPKTAVASLSESLRHEILVNTSELLDVIFKMNTYSATALLNLMDKKFFGDDFGIDSMEKIRLATWSMFKAMPTISTLGVTALNGLTALYVRAEIEDYRGHFLISSNTTSGDPTYYKEFVDANTGDPNAHAVVEDLLSLHNRQWFTDAMKVPNNNISWNIEPSVLSGQAFVQCSIPVQSHSTKEIAVIHSGHSANMINGFLSSLDLKGGRVFISDQNGRLLFSSDPTACVPHNKSRCEVTPLQTDSLLNEGKHFLHTKVGLETLVMLRTNFEDVNIRGKRYSIDSWPYEFHAVKLAVVIMIPRHSFWGPMDYYTRITWISLPLLSLGVVFIGCSLIYLLVEQVQAEEKLRAEIQRQSEAKCRAEASRDAKTNFLSSMSHELRTPMACIIGLLDMLLSEKLLDETASSLRQIHRCATSLVAILNSALDIAKVESGKLVLEKAEFDLEAELTALIDVFSVQCDNKGLFICLHLEDDVPKNVVGDSARVMQVFTNLIGNSIKFTSQGRIRVSGRLLEECANPGRMQRRSLSSFSLDMFAEPPTSDEVIVLFEVDDTGLGIDPALRERVFENFVQGDASTTRTHGGTGLGLGIVKSLVHIMGGNIKIVEKTGPGSVFQFTICFQRSLKPERVPYSVPPSLEGTEVVLGMLKGACRAIAAHWVSTWGLVTHEVDTFEEMGVHMRSLNGIPVNTKNGITGLIQRHHQADFVPPASPTGLDGIVKTARAGMTQKRPSRYEFWKGWQSMGAKASSGQQRQLIIIDVSLLPKIVEHDSLQEYLQQSGFLTGNSTTCYDARSLEKLHLNDRQMIDIQRNVLIVWVTASNTPEPVKAALRSVRNSIAVRRPLHAIRLKELLHQVASELGDCLPTMDAEKPKALSSNALAYAKQQEWDDPYRCDTEVSFPGIVKPVTVFDKAAKHVSTASLLISSIESRDANLPRKSINIRRRPSPKDELPARVVSKPLEKLDILVAEDTPLLRKLAVAMLKKLGATTHEAENGQEALDAVLNRIKKKQLPFNCILMDCQMPVMDGYEACKAVRDAENEGQQRTSIIALTANAMASDEQKCLHAGMDAFLTKPINQDYMIQVILQTVDPLFSERAALSPMVLQIHSAKVSKNGVSEQADLMVSVN